MPRAKTTAEMVAEELNTNSAENFIQTRPADPLKDKVQAVREKALECAEVIFTENQHPANVNQIEALKVAVELFRVAQYSY